AFNGRDGALAGGTLWIALTAYPSTFGATGWNVTTTHTATGPANVNMFYGDATCIPTPPSGVGSATPSSVVNDAFDSSVLQVVVTPGGNPASTAHTVTINLSSIGGSATQAMVEGPANTFTYTTTVSAATTTGVKTLGYTIQEVAPSPLTRSFAGNIGLT